MSELFLSSMWFINEPLPDLQLVFLFFVMVSYENRSSSNFGEAYFLSEFRARKYLPNSSSQDFIHADSRFQFCI